MKNILVCGFGNAAHVTSCLLGRFAKTSVLNLIYSENEAMKNISKEKQTLVCIHGKSIISGKIDKVTMNPAEVVPNADLIFFAIPSYVQEKYLLAIKPYLRPNQTIIFNPGSSNIQLLAQKCLGEKFDTITFAATKTLPCRINEFGKSARLLGQKAINVIDNYQNFVKEIAVTPKSKAPEVAKLMADLLGVYPLNEKQGEDKSKQFIPKWNILPNYLSITLMNINALIHPSLLYGHLSDWDGKQKFEKEIELYSDITEKHEKILVEQDQEILKIKQKIVKENPSYNVESIQSLHDWFLQSYGKTIKDKSRYYKCIKTNQPYAGLKVPMKQVEGGYIPTFTSRYYIEDIPTGLVSIKSLAEIAGVETPSQNLLNQFELLIGIDSIISWSQTFLNKEYVIGNKLIGQDIPETRALQNFGIKSLKDYLNLNK